MTRVGMGRATACSNRLYAWCAPGWNPFVTSINMDGTNDCVAYIDKLANTGTSYSPGKLIISASANGYGNTNYVLDGVRNLYPGGDGDPVVADAVTGLLSAGVPSAAIMYLNGFESGTPLPHLTNAANVAGYMSWGFHSSLGEFYATNGNVTWGVGSAWYIIETVESFNGQRIHTPYSGNKFIWWFATNAFGGSNYSNTPVGAVSHVDEPYLAHVNDSAKYFGLWASRKNFAICAWNSRSTPFFQAVGDPLVRR